MRVKLGGIRMCAGLSAVQCINKLYRLFLALCMCFLPLYVFLKTPLSSPFLLCALHLNILSHNILKLEWY